MTSPPRLYLITPSSFEPEAFAAQLETVLAAAPVACLRLRLAGADETMLTRAANHLIPACHGRDVALVIEDHWRLVEPLGLDGVHLAERRAPVRRVRGALGPDRIIGAFGGTSRHDAMIAAEAGADYVALGPVRAGGLGDGAEAPPELFDWWSEMIETPVIAEGGLSIETAPRLAASADFLAPCRSVWEAAEPAGAARAYAELLAGCGPE